VGLVGVNGCGKSTLLRCIGGVEKAESGHIETSKGLQVVYVDQEPAFPLGTRVRDVMFDPKGSAAMAAVREYQLASQALAEGTKEAYDRWG
jgi:ATPase subunit of ABC transporter with duplicated ATPase domains